VRLQKLLWRVIPKTLVAPVLSVPVTTQAQQADTVGIKNGKWFYYSMLQLAGGIDDVQSVYDMAYTFGRQPFYNKLPCVPIQ